MSTPKPRSVHLRTYRVGFGDCFLLRFEYSDRWRNVLIDFGSTAAPAHLKSTMKAVAEDIVEVCKDRLDAVVATHRHADHISGFAGQTWEILKKLKLGLVLLPWTEHPDAPVDAASLPPGPGDTQLRGMRHVRSLEQMHRVAELAATESKRILAERNRELDGDDDAADDFDPNVASRRLGIRRVQQLGFLGEDNLKNADAVRNLLSIADRDFLHFGKATKLSKVLPGVKIHVLGPPTLAQSDTVRAQRAVDVDEFWHIAGQSAGRTLKDHDPLFPGFKPSGPTQAPVGARDLIADLESIRGEQLLQLVRILDSVLNNTSLILLFEACGKKLLFPGDAQIENWAYALAQPHVRKLLADVSTYKVGHHGSLNATPKSMWKLFQQKKSKGGDLKTFMSSRPGKHGSSQNDSEVPRKKLVTELVKESDHYSTLDLKGGALWFDQQLA